jgi:phosphate starvation-inducible PhoH-like protein
MSKKTRRAHRAKPSPESQPSKTPSAADHSPYVHQRDKLDWDLHVRGRADLTAKQKQVIDLILDKRTKVLFLSGPAGTSKTWLAIYCGLLLLQQRRMSHLTFVRTIIESASKSLGSLPGEAEDKMSPYLMPLMDKLDELLPSSEAKRLMNEKRALGLPVNFLRGASLNAQYIVLEEAQNFTVRELTTALTRLGEHSKIVVIGDPAQSDINGQSAFQPLFDWFNQPSHREHGIHCFSFAREDIVRSGILRVIVEALEQFRAAHSKVGH